MIVTRPDADIPKINENAVTPVDAELSKYILSVD